MNGNVGDHFLRAQRLVVVEQCIGQDLNQELKSLGELAPENPERRELATTMIVLVRH